MHDSANANCQNSCSLCNWVVVVDLQGDSLCVECIIKHCGELQQQQQMSRSVDDISDAEVEAMAGMSEEEKARVRSVHKRRSASYLLLYALTLYILQLSACSISSPATAENSNVVDFINY